MCGIAGIYNFDKKPVLKLQIKKMTNSIAHRGPDDEGVFIDKNLGFGHRRLAIIDLSEAGHQPMCSEKGQVWLSYNGEIYNFLDLRKKLEKSGHRFKSRTDTEVVIHSYEEWGINCIKKFNGVFAFALWDKKNEKLFLVRDRYGARPLYYYIDDKKLIFASEIKAILENREIPKKVCLEGLKEYFTFQNIYSDKTFFDKIKLLPQASILEIDKSGKTRITKHWDFRFQTEKTLYKYKEYVEDLKKIFTKAVKDQLISDVPLGSYLSGGMDTGSIVGVASRYASPLMTFTGGFDLTLASGIEMLFDERKEAETMANFFGTRAYQMIIRPGDMERIMPNLIWHLEDPRVGMTYHNYYIAELASKFVKVVLGGTGGDEMFGGYPWRYKSALNSLSSEEFEIKLYNDRQRLVKEGDQKDFFTDKTYNEVKNYDLFVVLKSVFNKWDYEGEDELCNRALYFDAKTFLHGLLLIEDKISMAHSMETRVPFLDNNLVDFTLKIPFKYKVDIEILRNNNYLSSLGGKKILRKAMEDLIPKEILQRKKQGFSAPDASWYRGPSLSYVKKVLLDKRTLNRGYFQPKFIEKVIEEHCAGKINHRLLIWSLLCFEWWNRIFIEREFQNV